MKLAVSKGLKPIAFPSISTGAFGYPIEKASLIAIHTVKEFVEEKDQPEKVVLVLCAKHDLEVYEEKARAIISQS